MQLQYVLLPGRSNDIHQRGPTGLGLHNQAYEFWRRHWDQVFGELDGSRTVAADFSRHDYIATVLAEGRVMALHLYSVFRLDSMADRDHPYFSTSFETEFLDGLRARGYKKVMSMEYLTVSPEVRLSNPKSGVKMSFAHIIMGLGTQVQRSLGADAAIGPCRCDLKVDRLAKEYGAYTGDVRTMHNVPVASAAIPLTEIRECSREAERLEIQRLWDTRSDFRHGYNVNEQNNTVLTLEVA